MIKARFGLEGKRVIVLGGGFGMGEATCNLLADLGCHVAVLDIIPERAEKMALEKAPPIGEFSAVNAHEDQAVLPGCGVEYAEGV